MLHFLLLSSCLGQTKQMFGLEAGFIWHGGRKYWEICYWHLIPDVSVDCKTAFFFFISLFFSFFLLLAWIDVKWTKVIIHIWQGSWKYCILFLILLTVLLINPSPLIPLIRVRLCFFLCRCLKREIRCFPQSCMSDLHHCSNPLKGLSSKSFWFREISSCIWSMLCNINLFKKKIKKWGEGAEKITELWRQRSWFAQKYWNELLF